MKYVDFIVLYHASLEFSVGWKTDEQKWYGICVLWVGLCVCVNLVSFISVPTVENKFHKIQWFATLKFGQKKNHSLGHNILNIKI